MKYRRIYGSYFFIACLIIVSTVISSKIHSQIDSSLATKKDPKEVSQIIQNMPDIPNSENSQNNSITKTDNVRNEDYLPPASLNKNNRKTSTSRSSGGGGGGGSTSTSNQNPEVNIQATADVQQTNPSAQVPTNVCNPLLINNAGFDNSYIINLQACNLLNALYTQGVAAGNIADLYYNLDNNHVTLCFAWTPNPDCPQDHRLFLQHDWRTSDVGRATSPISSVTVGQASYRGIDEHGIAYVYYSNQQNAEEAYKLYTHNNLYIYPSLEDDSFIGSKESLGTLTNQIIDSSRANIANTPYIISSKEISYNQDIGSYAIHESSGNEFPFVKLALTSLAALKPEVKQELMKNVLPNDTNVSFLIPTIQMLMRYSHKSVNTDLDYLNNLKIHESMYIAHDFNSGQPQPAYDANKLISMTNNLTLNEIPPLVQLKVITETFDQPEKLFDTPGAIARSVPYNTSRLIIVNAQDSFDINSNNEDIEYIWKTANPLSATITTNLDNPAEATIEFHPANTTQRVDLFVFIKKSSGKYYSVPGVISEYIHS